MMLLKRLTDFYCDCCHLQFAQDFCPDLFCPYEHIICQKCADSTRGDNSMECPCCQTQIPRRDIMSLDFLHRLRMMAEALVGVIRMKNNEIIELKRHVGGKENRRLRDGPIKLTQYREPQEIINQNGYISRQEANNSKCEPLTFRQINFLSLEDIRQGQWKVPLVESCLEMDEAWQMRRDVRMSSPEVIQCQPDIKESKHKDDIYFSSKKPKEQKRQKQYSPFVMLQAVFKKQQSQNEGLFGQAVMMSQLQRERRCRDYEMNRIWAQAQARKNLNLRSRAPF